MAYRYRAFLIGFFPGALFAGTALAGTQDSAVIAMHAKAKATKASEVCTTESPNTQGISCDGYAVDNQPLNQSMDVYLVVARGAQVPGIAGASLGIAYTGAVSSFSWTLCADTDVPAGGWPGNGGGNVISWNPVTDCQTTVVGTEGVHAVLGAVYVYAYGDGTMDVTDNATQVPAEYQVSDCSGAVTDLVSQFPSVGFGSEPGYNPCDYDPHCYCNGELVTLVSCCCLPSGQTVGCLTQGECESQGGTYSVFTCGDFGSGCSPCEPVPVESRSWGTLKARPGE